MTLVWKPHHPAFDALLSAFLNYNSTVYIVGGAVRDQLLGRQFALNDIDIVVDSPALPTARRVADQLGWAYYAMDEARDVARLIFSANHPHPIICDIAGMRGDTIESDLWSRDFSVNAMALALNREGDTRLVDVCGGAHDLRKGILRRVTPLSLVDDSVRLIRAVRLLVQFGFVLERETQVQIERLARTVRLASAERVRDELWKMFALAAPASAVAWLQKLGLLAHVLPEVAGTISVQQSYPHHEDVFDHTLSVVREAACVRNVLLGREAMTDDDAHRQLWRRLEPWSYSLRHLMTEAVAVGHTRADWLIWLALFHDVGKPSTQKFDPRDEEHDGAGGSGRYRSIGHEVVGADLAEQRLLALRFSRHEIDLAGAVIRAHMRPHLLHAGFHGRPISRRAAFRYFRNVGGKQFDYRAGIDTLMLALADYLATYQQSPPPAWTGYLDHASELLAFSFDDSAFHAAVEHPLVDGHFLMKQFDLKPGRHIGHLLQYLQEAQVAGEVSSVDDALALAADWLNSQSLDRQ